jgi:hypothetical protein
MRNAVLITQTMIVATITALFLFQIAMLETHKCLVQENCRRADAQ